MLWGSSSSSCLTPSTSSSILSSQLTASTAREFMTKDAKTGKMRDTGVRFKDIAGLDHIVVEMKEVVKMLLGEPSSPLNP